MVSLLSLGADLEHLDGDLGRLRGLGEHQVARREAEGSPKLNLWCKQGPRGNCSAASGGPLGEGGAEASPLVLGINSARPNHAKAWGGGYSTAARIPPGRSWEAKVIIISTEGLHNNMLNGGA